MRYLLDTHVALWFLPRNPRIPEEIYDLIEDPRHAIFYSVISPWELAIKEANGKIRLPEEFFAALPRQGFTFLPIMEEHIETLRQLPRIHSDPFDRMLIAQAKTEQLTVITADKKLTLYPIKTLQV